MGIRSPRGASLPLALALAVLVMGACSKKEPTLRTGDPLPPLTLNTPSGATASLPSDFTDPVTVILFWQEGCHYCKRGMPDLQALYERLHPSGMGFIAIQVGGEIGATLEMAQKNALAFPMLHDPGSLAIEAYGLAGVPTTFFMDAKGTVTEKILGGVAPDQLEAMVREKLGPGALPQEVAPISNGPQAPGVTNAMAR